MLIDKIRTSVIYGFILLVSPAIFVSRVYPTCFNKATACSLLMIMAAFGIIQLLDCINHLHNQNIASTLGQGISFIVCGFVAIQLILGKHKHVKRKNKNEQPTSKYFGESNF